MNQEDGILTVVAHAATQYRRTCRITIAMNQEPNQRQIIGKCHQKRELHFISIAAYFNRCNLTLSFFIVTLFEQRWRMLLAVSLSPAIAQLRTLCYQT